MMIMMMRRLSLKVEEEGQGVEKRRTWWLCWLMMGRKRRGMWGREKESRVLSFSCGRTGIEKER